MNPGKEFEAYRSIVGVWKASKLEGQTNPPRRALRWGVNIIAEILGAPFSLAVRFFDSPEGIIIKSEEQMRKHRGNVNQIPSI